MPHQCISMYSQHVLSTPPPAGATIPTVRKAALQDALGGLVRRVLDHEKKAAVSCGQLCLLCWCGWSSGGEGSDCSGCSLNAWLPAPDQTEASQNRLFLPCPRPPTRRRRRLLWTQFFLDKHSTISIPLLLLRPPTRRRRWLLLWRPLMRLWSGGTSSWSPRSMWAWTPRRCRWVVSLLLKRCT